MRPRKAALRDYQFWSPLSACRAMRAIAPVKEIKPVVHIRGLPERTPPVILCGCAALDGLKGLLQFMAVYSSR